MVGAVAVVVVVVATFAVAPAVVGAVAGGFIVAYSEVMLTYAYKGVLTYLGFEPEGLVQMLGTVTPLFLFPAQTWEVFPIAPTLEGQYIIKNVVLVAGAVVLGATVRGGGLSAEPGMPSEPQ